MSTNKKKLLFKPKKNLGQNFIFDNSLLSLLVKKMKIPENSLVVEIGSGYGQLTEKILQETKCQVIGIEKDEKLFEELKKTEEKENSRIKYLNLDVLKIKWFSFLKEINSNNLPIFIVGNIPYYLANSLVIELTFLEYCFFYGFSFLVQEEVAKRWVSEKYDIFKKECSAISILMDFFFELEFLETVEKKFFLPIPKVNGSLVRAVKRKENETKLKKKDFFVFLKKCFQYRRKTLFNNLICFSWKKKTKWINFFSEKKIDIKVRPSDLSTNFYWELFKINNI